MAESSAMGAARRGLNKKGQPYKRTPTAAQIASWEARRGSSLPETEVSKMWKARVRDASTAHKAEVALRYDEGKLPGYHATKSGKIVPNKSSEQKALASAKAKAYRQRYRGPGAAEAYGHTLY